MYKGMNMSQAILNILIILILYLALKRLTSAFRRRDEPQANCARLQCKVRRAFGVHLNIYFLRLYPFLSRFNSLTF